MAAPTAAPPYAIARRVSFDRLHGFSSLFARYATGDASALRFFAHDWRDPAAHSRSAERAAAVERDRGPLVDVLHEQNVRWANDGAAVQEHLEALRSDASVAVVTGQQLGLFGGPLYTLFKAITAIQLARRMTEATGRAVIPVFWLADEDHDWEEVRSAVVIEGDRTRALALEASSNREPTGRRLLGNEVDVVLRDLGRLLPHTAATPELLTALQEAYRPGKLVLDAFAEWMAGLFASSGLVLLSADEPRLKRIAAPILRQEINDPGATLSALLEAGGRLEDEGFHQQVRPLAGQLFLMEPDGRRTLDPRGNGSFALRGTRHAYHQQDLIDLLEEAPERFSPNVVLRPIVEDYLLPTVAYVAGPGETSYYAQLRGVYDRFGVPMPVVYPRASVTLVEPRVRRVLERYDLSLEELGDGSDRIIHALHARLAMAQDSQPIEKTFASARDMLHQATDAVKPIARGVDGSLDRSAEAMRKRLLDDLAFLETKVTRAQKRAHSEIGRQLRLAVTHLLPERHPQERVLSPVHVLNRYGMDLPAQLIATLDTDTSQHQIVEL